MAKTYRDRRPQLRVELHTNRYRGELGRYEKITKGVLKKQVYPMAKEMRGIMVEASKAEVPVVSGDMRDAIYGRVFMTPGANPSVRITVAVAKRIKYTDWVIHGRGWVFPVKKKALWWPGLPHPVAFSRPSKPNPFFDRSLRKVKPKLQRRWNKIPMRVRAEIEAGVGRTYSRKRDGS